MPKQANPESRFDRSGLEIKMREHSYEAIHANTLGEKTAESPTMQPTVFNLFSTLQGETNLPAESINEILLYEGRLTQKASLGELTHQKIWQWLKKASITNSEAVNYLKHNAIWKLLFERCFPQKSRLTQEKSYFSAFKREYQHLLEAVTRNGIKLAQASAPLKDDFKIVQAAVTQYGWALVHASEALKADRNIVLAAITQCAWALQYASETLKNDPKIALTAIAKNRQMIRHVSSELRNIPEICTIARIQDDAARTDACTRYLEELAQHSEPPASPRVSCLIT